MLSTDYCLGDLSVGHRFADLMFSAPVQAVQQEQDSQHLFLPWRQREDFNNHLTGKETDFISARNSFYMASVNPDGWPYIQHRGGPTGFVKILNHRQLGFADYHGNKQYISTGNLRSNPRVSLFFMDYANRRRLKMLGHVEEVSLHQTELIERLSDSRYPARIERGFVITVAAFDWNCSQHITRRFEQATQ